jgi:hypothetical protein
MEWKGVERRGQRTGPDRIGLERMGADRSGEARGLEGIGRERTGEERPQDRIGLEGTGTEWNGVERRNGLRPVAQVWRPGPDEQPTRKDRKCTRKSMKLN